MTRLRELRLKTGKSIKQVSNETGIASNYLSEMETGKKDISRKCLPILCNYYKCKPNDILEYDDFIFIDESNREFREIDIKLLNILKALDESDRAELENFINFLIYKHQKRIEDIENGSKKGN